LRMCLHSSTRLARYSNTTSVDVSILSRTSRFCDEVDGGFMLSTVGFPRVRNAIGVLRCGVRNTVGENKDAL